jgi:hypothetical protein
MKLAFVFGQASKAATAAVTGTIARQPTKLTKQSSQMKSGSSDLKSFNNKGMSSLNGKSKDLPRGYWCE